jgi:SAM-dependent methyltransferase
VTTAKYGPQAESWTEDAYADATTYLSRRARLIAQLGPALEPGDRVLDLACGDGGLGEHLLELGYRYVGVDANEAMVAAARRRLGERAEIVPGDLNDFVPNEPVQATTVFRAIYYARDRLDFFRQAARYTERKLVFDLNPRQYRLETVVADLRAAGFDRVALRPFFSPQTVSLPGPVARALAAVERVGPLARLALRFRFTYVCAAFRSGV